MRRNKSVQKHLSPAILVWTVCGVLCVSCGKDDPVSKPPTPEKEPLVTPTPLPEDNGLKPAPSHIETVDITQIVNWASSYTHSSITPMGQHFENARTATADDLAWLNNPAANPMPMAGMNEWCDRTVNLYPFGAPVPADVNQHNVGDCSACAVWASLAYLYPDFIKKIITDRGEGIFTVDMFDPMGNPIQVSVNSQFLCTGDGFVGQVTGKNNVPTWATILEKALMKWEQVYQVDGVEGIGSEHVAPLFTGNGDSFAYAPNRLHASELTMAVKHFLKEGYIVIGGFDEPDLLCGQLYSVVAHAFTLMLPSHDNCLFSMRNPWGIERVDGVLNIPDQRRVTQAIDLRVISSGAAAPYLKPDLEAYQPPLFVHDTRDIGASYRMNQRVYRAVAQSQGKQE